MVLEHNATARYSGQVVLDRAEVPFLAFNAELE
jgi:hypothetical protein